MAGHSLVSGDGWISDDSILYASIYPRLPSALAYQKKPGGKTTKIELHNFYEGEPNAWQLNETVDDFLNRLRPSSGAVKGPWIWVANPYFRKKHPATNVPAMVERGRALLDEYAGLKEKTERAMVDKAKAAVTRKLKPPLLELEKALRRTAKENHCLVGKWMLFPSDGVVDETWRVVAKATIEGRLGISAKVAAGRAAGRDASTRLICVYTEDFSNTTDVKRVLDELVNIGLGKTDASSRGIYYKADCYTYLDIESQNRYGLKASMYSSRDMLGTN